MKIGDITPTVTMAKRPPARRKESSAAVLLVTIRRLQSDLANLTLRFERLERQCEMNIRRCGEQQAEIDALKKRVGPG